MYQRVLLSFFFLLALTCMPACSQQEESGPGEVRWDRETCTHCNMAIGDRHYAVQIRGAAAREKTKLYKFDDFGCALTWLNKQHWKDEDRTEIWVADFRNGNWLDARKAVYIKDKLTPMNYGLGAVDSAQADEFADALDYTQAKAYILAEEQVRYQHGSHSPASQDTAGQQ
jgi:nitrous oxide reductase accessory protein NosL